MRPRLSRKWASEESLYAHNIAKVLLARAIGNAGQAVKQYLAEPGSTLPSNRTSGPGTDNTSETMPNAAPGPSGMVEALDASPAQQKVGSGGDPIAAPHNPSNGDGACATFPHE